jgi:transposase
MLRGGKVKQIYELHGQGLSVRRIAKILGRSRNSVRKYLRSPGVPQAKPRAPRKTKLDPYASYVRQRVAEGVENCVVLLRELLRELRARGYTGKYTVLKDFVQPLRQRPPAAAVATMRYETAPGEQGQVDFGYCTYTTPEGVTRGIWVFVLVLGWSRALYVEFVRRADTATFLRAHLNAFTALGGVPQRCLYDNPKIVVLDRDEAGQPVWNPRFLDFALRVGWRCAVPSVPAADEGESGEWRRVRQRELLADGAVRGRRRPEPAGTGVGGHGRQRAPPWHHARTSHRPVGAGATSAAGAARRGPAAALCARRA